MTVITSGAGFSTPTVSRAGADTSFRATFFTGARLGLPVRFVAFADFASLRALPRLAEFARRSFARFRTFDCFLRLAMIDPPWSGWCVTSYPQGIADQLINGILGDLSNEFSKREWVPCLPK